MSLVEKKIDSGAGIITLLDGEGGNRLNPSFLGEFSAALRDLSTDEKAKFIIIRSRGRNFCLGMDLVALEKGHAGMDDVVSAVKDYTSLLSDIYHSPKTVVALIDGPVKAGGMGIAAACDVVLASERASFELSEALIGIIPANVLPYLFMLRVPPQKARYLVLTAAQLDAHKAHAVGLVDEVYTVEGFEKGVKSLCRQIMRTSPQAVSVFKDFTHQFLESDFNGRKVLAEQTLFDLIKQESVLAAVKKFNEGDLPPWFGRFKPSEPVTG
ncbi:enoyl-CoA hydratase/isomerase family protein [Spirochaeta isovalerica]|uniref:Enoyl-CoA hydratase/carnithine racemase n=1 Tax=Spirochaeta isovalerica TaxID=150 RepID=A0A841RAK1_9SPIO|nr:enoyl-CoA hydratase/isomerase family protein [Spirochaeta isovalerica]MBB6479708.1 enoyl-CoA hydratase/carnithine racemase [Spirochaeta isovalerica]